MGGIFKAGSVLPHGEQNQRSRILDFCPRCETEQTQRCDREPAAPEGPSPCPRFRGAPSRARSRGEVLGEAITDTRACLLSADSSVSRAEDGGSWDVLLHAENAPCHLRQGRGSEGTVPWEGWTNLLFPRAPAWQEEMQEVLTGLEGSQGLCTCHFRCFRLPPSPSSPS